MKQLIAIAVLAVLVLACSATPILGAQARIRAGNYAITTTTGGKSHSSNHCVTGPELKAANGDATSMQAFAESTAAQAHFTIHDFKMTANTMSFTMVGSGMSVVSTTTYHGDSYEMAMTMTSATGVTNTRVNGHWTGACA